MSTKFSTTDPTLTDHVLPTPSNNKKATAQNMEKDLAHRFGRMLSGKPLDDVIIDPANPNLIQDRDD